MPIVLPWAIGLKRHGTCDGPASRLCVHRTKLPRGSLTRRIGVHGAQLSRRAHGHELARPRLEFPIEGGAQASGQAIAGLCRGAPADLVALYDDDPMLTGHGDESRLDALVFSGYRLPIEGVMVHGEWLVADGEHRSGAATRDAFRAAAAVVGARR